MKTVDLAVVLLDIGLLNGDGPAVFETIQATVPLLPVGVLTAAISKDYVRGRCSAAYSPTSQNYTIAMSCVPCPAQRTGALLAEFFIVLLELFKKRIVDAVG